MRSLLWLAGLVLAGCLPAIDDECGPARPCAAGRCLEGVCLGDATLAPEQATAIFRIFQETLTNVMRHAQASQVHVIMEGRSRQLILRVHDNGRGIKECQISDSKSLGLLGMRERVLPWEGEVNIQGGENQGTTVTIKINMENQ